MELSELKRLKFMRKTILITWMILLCVISVSEAQFKRQAKPKPPTLQEQYDAAKAKGPDAVREFTNNVAAKGDAALNQELQEIEAASAASDFTDDYNAMAAQGGPAFDDWKRQVRNGRNDRDKEFLKNLEDDKRADGKNKTRKDRQREEDAKNPPNPGFMGDPTDPGPTDWSDYIIETDANGNVTGFKPKDYYDRDTDGDGKVSEDEQQAWDNKEQVKNMDKDGDGTASLEEIAEAEKEMDANEDGQISDEERDWWNDKEKAEREAREATEQNGGPPGAVPPIADWDQDQDGKPDPGFKLDCWTCETPDDPKNECHNGLPGVCDAHSCLDANDEVCIQANEVHDGKEYECYRCEVSKKKEEPGFCENNGYTSDAACDGACSGDMCMSIDVDRQSGLIVPPRRSRQRDSTVTCYRCTTINEGPCQRMDAFNGGCPGNCNSQADVCYPFTVEGAQCHRCEPLTDDETCNKFDMQPGGCPGTCSDGQACAMQRKGGVLCHTCQTGAVGPDPCENVTCASETDCLKEECVQGKCVPTFKQGPCDDGDACTDSDQCQDGQCKGSAIAVPPAETCKEYACESDKGIIEKFKDGTSCDDQDTCTSNDLCSQGVCAGTPIPQCRVNQDCAANVPGSTASPNCNGECPAELCEATPVYGDPNNPQGIAYTCYKCRPGCADDSECDDGQFCNGPEKCVGGECVPGEEPCHGEVCDESGDRCVSCQSEGLEDGGCPGTCREYMEVCSPVDPVAGLKCHNCYPKNPASNCKKQGLNDGVCPGVCDPDFEACKDSSVDGESCHSCSYKTSGPNCAAELGTDWSTSCPSDCPEQNCEMRMISGLNGTGTCWRCKPSTGFPRDCPEGTFPGMCFGNDSCPSNTKCRDVMLQGAECHRCQPITGGSDPDDLISVPGGDPIGGLQTQPIGSLPGETITTGGTPTDGFVKIGDDLIIGGDVSQLVVEIEYFILIVETPRGRYVLNKKGTMDLGDFKVSQVMQLVKADSAKQAVQSMGSMFPKGGMNIASFLSAGGIGVGDFQNLLMKGMNKGRRYSDDCFEREDNFAETQIPDAVEPAEKLSKRDDPPSEPQSFGQSGAKEVAADGPMVACGEKDGRKALAIMDAHGRIVDYIFRDMIDGDPNAIQNALLKAQRMTDLVQDVSDGNWRGILQRVQRKVIDKVQSRVETAVKDFFAPEDDEVMIEPDDPFYRPPAQEGKKKKLFGVLGSSKKAAKVTIGSTMKMGGRGKTLGAQEDQYKDKREEMKWQWGIHRVGYTPLEDPDSAWHLVDEQRRNVVVAVIDSGLDMNHVDGPEHVWVNTDEIPGNGVDDDNNGYVDDVNGWNFLDNNADLTDEQGHGSFVAGIIAAKTNNGYGMAGINPGAVIMPIKVADKDGQTTSFMITRAIYYAVDNGAKIINISLGARVPSRMEELAFRYAYKQGVFIAAAAGNVGEDIQEHGPASVRGAFAVGAMDFEETRSTISNWGANNGLLAPGDRIISLIAEGTGKKLKPSTLKAGFYPQSGTSFSTPIVAATASLLLAQNPDLTNLDIEDILHRTADDMEEPGWDEYTGAGVLNAKAALSEDVNDRVTAKFTGLDFVDTDRDRAVNVYATVRGDFESFIVEVGKGERAKKFKYVAGPFVEQANHDLITQIERKEHLRGSKDWVLRITVTHHDGTQTTAHTSLRIK